MKRIVFYCIAGKEYGMGHVKRCLNIAMAMDPKGIDIGFVVFSKTGQKEVKKLIGANFRHQMLDTDGDEMLKVLGSQQPDLILVDRLSYDMTDLRGLNATIIALDNYRQGADRYINILKEQTFEHSAIEANGYQYWALKPPDERKEKVNGLGRILISCGYSDPNGLTEKIAKALNNYEFKSTENSPLMPEIECVITSLFVPGTEKRLQELSEGVRVKKDLSDIGPEICRADLCFCAGGNTMIEMIIRSVPCIVIAACPKNHSLASDLKADGYVIDVLDFAEEKNIHDALDKVTMKKLCTIHENCLKFDGSGLERIKKILLEELNHGI